jgi:hypothetical protein
MPVMAVVMVLRRHDYRGRRGIHGGIRLERRDDAAAEHRHEKDEQGERFHARMLKALPVPG